ncbi:MAG: SBBP repeat-containing protein [Acidobacteria bacterium]|nr:SBBP repeat-containing protein [Acidobacteriota bacterium]
MRHLLNIVLVGIVFAVSAAAVNTSAPAQPKIVDVVNKLPLAFEANRGQTNPAVKFLSRGAGYNLFLTSTEAVLVLRAQQAEVDGAGDSHPAVLRMKFIGANPSAVTGIGELSGKANYFRGKSLKEWQTKIPTYSKVRYRDIYPGVDLLYYGNGRQLEYDLIAAPGARTDSIRLKIDGAQRLALQAGGDLILQTADGDVRLAKPFIYQDVTGGRREIQGSYVITAKDEIGFRIGAYDTSKPLVIDPVLVYGTYLGGTGNDSGRAITVDSIGNVYVTGYTESLNFPVAGALQTNLGGNSGRDVFVTKLNPAGTALVFSTFIGGAGQEQANCIAVDSTGNVYIAGSTMSADFPVILGGIKITYSSPYEDGFITKLAPDGATLVFSTYFGGTGQDQIFGIAVDATGNAFIAGRTDSDIFPTTAGAFQTASAGAPDAFVAELNSLGNNLVFSTLLSGEGVDGAFAIALDSMLNIVVTGVTNSLSFPFLNAFQTGWVGATDVFVTKLNSAGMPLFSTYIGGQGTDQGNAVAVDTAGNVYVTGLTNSPDFPTMNALQQAIGGSFANAFVTKFNASGGMVYSTYLGGSGGSNGTGISADATGNAFVTGSAGVGFPTANPIQNTPGGGVANAFVSKLNATGTALTYSTYLGGNGNDQGAGIKLDSAGNAYVVGTANSTNFPTVQGSFQAAARGGSDAFVVKLSETNNPVPTITSISPTTAQAGGPAFALTVIGSNFILGSAVQWNGSARPTTLVSTSQLTAAIPASDIATVGAVQVTVFNPPSGGGASNAVSFTINPSAPPAVVAISPNTVTAGAAAFTLTITGSNFGSASVVQWNGSSRPTTFVSSTQLTASIPASDVALAGTAQIAVSSPSGGASGAVTFSIAPTTPIINPNGVVNGASFAAGAAVAAGSVTSLFGNSFSASVPGGLTVVVNGIAAPVYSVSPQQVNFQMPWEVAGLSEVSVQVSVGAAASSPIVVPLAAYAPGIFLASATGTQGAILIAGSAFVAAPVGAFTGSRPANRGEFITIYCTGLGAVTNQPGTGARASESPLSATTAAPVVTIGGLPASVSFSGLAPGFFGLYQVDVQVPQNLSPGSSVPVVLNIGGVSSNSVTIAVQ